MSKVICRHCHHPEEVHNVRPAVCSDEASASRARSGECACGCIKLVPRDDAAREARRRTWLVVVKMFVKNRWIESGQMRIRSGGAANASAIAVRQARRECVKPRTRVEQISIEIVPVSRRTT